jgi:hypothetical protein
MLWVCTYTIAIGSVFGWKYVHILFEWKCIYTYLFEKSIYTYFFFFDKWVYVYVDTRSICTYFLTNEYYLPWTGVSVHTSLRVYCFTTSIYLSDCFWSPMHRMLRGRRRDEPWTRGPADDVGDADVAYSTRCVLLPGSQRIRNHTELLSWSNDLTERRSDADCQFGHVC